MVRKKEDKAAPEQSGVVLVRMEYEGKRPSDVHPGEVENWKALGWREVKDGSGH